MYYNSIPSCTKYISNVDNKENSVDVRFLCCFTRCGAVVSDVAVHVDCSAVDAQVPHAADKVAVPHGEVFGQVGNTTKQQWSSQVQ